MNPTSASRQSLSLGAEFNRAALRTQTSTPRGTKRPACNPVQARMSTPRAAGRWRRAGHGGAGTGLLGPAPLPQRVARTRGGCAGRFSALRAAACCTAAAMPCWARPRMYALADAIFFPIHPLPPASRLPKNALFTPTCSCCWRARRLCCSGCTAPGRLPSSWDGFCGWPPQNARAPCCCRSPAAWRSMRCHNRQHCQHPPTRCGFAR